MTVRCYKELYLVSQKPKCAQNRLSTRFASSGSLLTQHQLKGDIYNSNRHLTQHLCCVCVVVFLSVKLEKSTLDVASRAPKDEGRSGHCRPFAGSLLTCFEGWSPLLHSFMFADKGRRVHKPVAMPSIVAKQFFSNGPVGACLVFSIYQSSSQRVGAPEKMHLHFSGSRG